MKRSALPNQKKNYAMLKARMNEYSLLVERAYQSMCFEAAEIALSVGYEGVDEFFFKKYPQTKAALRQMQTRLVSSLSDVVYSGTSAEWRQSNLIQDLLATKVLSAYDSNARYERHKVYFQENNDALKTFLARKEKGLTLSDKLWKQARDSQRQIEEALSLGIEKGMSAITLSKKLSQYLADFPSMQRDYREKFGKASTAKNCEYQSMQLARTEINMAYRMAEQLRWRQMDFVLGYEIKLSGSHKVRDICDDVAGIYPKTFIFLGWHPNCYCYCIPILKTEEQFYSLESGEDLLVKDVPDGYKLWVLNNADRIASAKSLPYFLRDNPEWREYVSAGYHKISESNYSKSYKVAEKKLLRQKYEQLIILTKKGDTVGTISGNVASVYFGDDFAKKLKNNILVHNHPNGGIVFKDFRDVGHSLSSSDVKEAIRCDMRSIVAISPTYRYIMERPTAGWKYSAEETNSRYALLFKEVKEEYKDQLNEKRVYILQHLTMKRLAKEFGFTYRKEKIK